VIRRGDRRPFYAPARYVTELGSESGEWDAAFTGDVVHYRHDSPALFQSFIYRDAPFTDLSGYPANLKAGRRISGRRIFYFNI
jgi:hypothetical protein